MKKIDPIIELFLVIDIDQYKVKNNFLELHEVKFAPQKWENGSG